MFEDQRCNSSESNAFRAYRRKKFEIRLRSIGRSSAVRWHDMTCNYTSRLDRNRGRNSILLSWKRVIFKISSSLPIQCQLDTVLQDRKCFQLPITAHSLRKSSNFQCGWRFGARTQQVHFSKCREKGHTLIATSETSHVKDNDFRVATMDEESDGLHMCAQRVLKTWSRNLRTSQSPSLLLLVRWPFSKQGVRSRGTKCLH